MLNEACQNAPAEIGHSPSGEVFFAFCVLYVARIFTLTALYFGVCVIGASSRNTCPQRIIAF